MTLHSLTPMEARRIVEREPGPDDRWYANYPLEDELDPLRALAASPPRRLAASREPEAIFTS